jgi:hypothetical protein
MVEAGHARPVSHQSPLARVPRESWETGEAWPRPYEEEALVVVRLIDPRNEQNVDAHAPARRLTTLVGATLAFMDISKPGGSIFLDRLETLLTRDHGVARVARTMKPTFTKRAPDSVIEQLRVADAVVLALAD